MKKNVFIFFGLILFFSCTTSKITSSWKAETTQAKQYKKILVIGLIRETDRSIQEKMENHFVGDLQSLGYQAVSASAEYGPNAFENMDEKTALEKIKNSGVDAVLTIVLLDKEKEKNYKPVRPQPTNFWTYYGRYNRRIMEKEYYVINTKYFWESNFYDMDNNQALLYSVQTQSFDPASAEDMGHEYGKMIVKDMLSNNILQDTVLKMKK